MDKVIPFKALCYNQKKIKDISRVVCPPYDVINDSMRKGYLEKDSYNIVRVILSQASKQKNKYDVAKELFNDWQRKQILVKDSDDCIYLYRVSFKINGVKKQRIGFLSLLNLDINKNNKVFPHEHTHKAPKIDRLKLVSKVKANLSPIFVLYEDKKHFIDNLCKKYAKQYKPFMKFTVDGLTNEIWRINDIATIKNIQAVLNSSQLFIADGHHRFEVNKMYLQKMRKKHKGADLRKFSYCLSYFLDATSKGVEILPIHRVLRNIPKQKVKDLIRLLEKHFTIKQLKNKGIFLSELKKNKSAIGLYNGRYYLLFLNNRVCLDKMMNKASRYYKGLSVVALNKLVVENILGLKLLDYDHIRYTHDLNEAVSMVDKNQANFTFLMNPVEIESLLGVAFSNEKMPPKSTFFFPKVLTGLLINKF